ncbi:MAG: hypothetical protein AB1589_07950 [Cyanobacteriota bacterium]
MFHKHPKQNSSPSNLEVAPLRELVVELDKEHEELLSGGSSNYPEIKKPTNNSQSLVVALVLLFANPFA